VSLVVSSSKWDERFFRIADEVASWSKDPTTKVGAVVVDAALHIKGTGYNGFPRGVNDAVPARSERPEKYLWTVHSEENAILSCDVRPRGCTLYCNLMPCMRCAGAIVQAGITVVKVDYLRTCAYGRNLASQYPLEFAKVEQMFIEADVNLYLVERNRQVS
jgi:dCMP deaminase